MITAQDFIKKMTFSKKAQEIIDDFSKQRGVINEHVCNLKLSLSI